MNDQVKSILKDLQGYQDKHIQVGRSLLSTGSVMYHLDMLAIASLNRSLQLTAGFCTLVEAENFLAAAPLLRLELDTALRFFAATSVSDPHIFVVNILNGIPVRKQKDSSGKFMTDQYLVAKVSANNSWVKDVYEHTSGYVHLSEKHMVNSMQLSGDQGYMDMKISRQDTFVPDEIYQEAIEAFQASADLLFGYIEDWVEMKSNFSSSGK